MASRRLSKSFSTAIKAHNAFSRPSLRSRAFSADAYFSSIAFPNSFLFRPNSYIGVSRNGITSVTQAVACGQLLPHSLQFPSPRRFSDKANKLGFTEMACQGLLKAVDVAHVLKQQTVESEHLMKALLEDKDGRARKIFAKAGIDNSSV